MSQEARLDWIEPEHVELALRRQCELAGVPRSTGYRRIDAAARQRREDEEPDGAGMAFLGGRARQMYTNARFADCFYRLHG